MLDVLSQSVKELVAVLHELCFRAAVCASVLAASSWSVMHAREQAVHGPHSLASGHCQASHCHAAGIECTY